MPKKFIASILTLSMLAVEFSFAASAHQVVVVNKAASTVLPSAPTTASSNQISIESLKKDMTEIYNPSEKTKSDLGLRETKTFNCGKPTSGKDPTDKITAVLDLNTQELTISGEGEMIDWSMLNKNLPPWYEESYNKLIDSVTISEGVTSIGAFSFAGMLSLNEVTLSKSVKSIEDSAFKGCAHLVKINFAQDGKLEKIGPSAFEETGLEQITIPDTVTLIDKVAFKSCQHLKCLIIGNKVGTIGKGAFKFSNYLYSVNFKGSTAPNFDEQHLPFTSELIKKVRVPNDYNSDKFCKLDIEKKEKSDLEECEKPLGLTIKEKIDAAIKKAVEGWHIGLTIVSGITAILAVISTSLGIYLSCHQAAAIKAAKANGGAEMYH